MTSRINAIVAALCIIGCIAAFTGCDQSPAPSVQVNPATEPPSDTRPTTQELLTGQYKKIAIPNVPLTMQVPVSWKIDMRAGGLTFLDGDTPDSHATIQLSNRDPISKERFTALFERLTKPDESSPTTGTQGKIESREVGTMKIVERFSTGRPVSIPRSGPRGEQILDSSGNPIIDTTTPVHWLFTIFYPEGNLMSYSELNCIGLTAEQYTQDKELLQKIFGSLQYEESTVVPPRKEPAR